MWQDSRGWQHAVPLRRLIIALCLLSLAMCGQAATGPARALNAADHRQGERGVADLQPGSPPISGEDTAAQAAATVVSWLRVVPHYASTIFIGGYGHCRQSVLPSYGIACEPWLMRSIDAGTTWSWDWPVTLPSPYLDLDSRLDPIKSSADGRHLYMSITGGLTNDSLFGKLLASDDGGTTWRIAAPCEHPNGCWDLGSDYAVSPVSGLRLFGISSLHGSAGECCAELEYSNTGGASWRGVGWRPTALLPQLPSVIVLADPVHLDTIYLVVQGEDVKENTVPTAVYRTDDLGVQWTGVITPTASPSLRTFTVDTDPHEGRQLVGRTLDPQVPRDRRYLSSDEGRTWRVATCPGDRNGACPAFTVDNVFGNGASYAFVDNGLYEFHGGGPAEHALATGGRLPVGTAGMIDVQAGSKAGQPVYILADQVRGSTQGVIYRTLDQGRTWQQLAGLVLTGRMAPLSPAPTRGHADHSVIANTGSNLIA